MLRTINNRNRDFFSNSILQGTKDGMRLLSPEDSLPVHPRQKSA
jgi:hypothetical protein